MHTLVAVASRLLAIYLVLVAFRYSSYVFFSYEITDSVLAVIGITVVGVAVPIAAAIFLWRKPLFVAKALLPPGADEKSPMELSESSLFTVLVTVLGFYLVITGGAALAGSIAEYLTVRNASGAFPSVSPSFWSPLVRSGLELFLGIALVLRANGLKRMYFSLKEGGLGEKAKSDR